MKLAMNSRLKQNGFVFLIIAAGILLRLVPHVPNFTPLLVFALYLGSKYSKAKAVAFTLAMAIVSDIILGLTGGYGIFGSWTIFSYSALFIIALIGSYKLLANKYKLNFLIGAVSVSFFYWLWTNFGTWIFSSMYPHTVNGFIACYMLALPFLQTSLMAAIAWSLIIMLFEKTVINPLQVPLAIKTDK